MKKGKRWLSIALAGMLTLSLCACNKDNPTGLGGNGSNGNAQNGGDNFASKEFVYALQEIDLGIDLENVGMYNMAYADGRIYTVIEDYSNSLSEGIVPRGAVVMPEVDPGFAVEGPEENDVAVEENTETEEPVTEDTDGDGVADAPSVEGDIDLPIIEEPIPDYEYYGPSYYLVSAKVDGSDQKMSKLSMGESMEKIQGYMSGVHLLKDGSVVASFESYMEDMSDPNNPIFKSMFYVMRWSNTGELQWTTDVSDEQGNYFYIRAVIPQENGELMLLSGNSEMVIVDAQGTVTSRKSMDSIDLNNMGQMIQKQDGNLWITSYNDDWTKFFISDFNMTTGVLGEKKELPGNMVNYNIYPGVNTDLLLSNSFGIYSYNIGDAEPVKLMDFINSDVATYGLNNISFLDEKSFVANYYDTTESKNKVAKFTYVDPKDIPDKKSIVLGCNYLGYDVKKRVIDFNKTNTNYRITIKDYSSYNTMSDYTLAQTQMNNDIISGNMPDIMIIENNQDISSWANKGLLADVKELIAKDAELSKVEFLQNVWDAFSINDKLYLVVPDFTVQTMAARKDMVGDRTGWTMTEFQQFMKTQDPSVKPFGGEEMLRGSVLSYIMTYCGSDFVDVNTGKCNFNSEEFIALLEFTKTFPVEFSQDYWDEYDWEAMQGVFRDKKAVLMHTYIGTVRDLVYTLHGQLGAEAAFVGYPGVEGNSSVMHSGSYLYAISAKSKNIDGAWSFVRYYLTDEYQSSEQMYSLPVSKTAFEAKAKLATEKPYWFNEETGEKEEYNHTYYINGEEIILEPFTQQEVDDICNFIYTVDKRSYYNQNIINIVNEEAESFFSGQKSARDAAGIIQSRVQLYVDENR